MGISRDRMFYRGVIMDLDGTAIPNRRDGMPSERLRSALRRLPSDVVVGVATGRPLSGCAHIIEALSLQSLCVVSGGTQIFDPTKNEVVWEVSMSEAQVGQLLAAARDFRCPLYMGDSTESVNNVDAIAREDRILYFMAVPERDTHALVSLLADVPDVAAHAVPSWTSGAYDIHVTHVRGTKLRALEKWLELVAIPSSSLVAFGDGNNDLPMFELAAYRVAMENSTDELKAQADEIAPLATDDGVAIVLERLFGLNVG